MPTKRSAPKPSAVTTDGKVTPSPLKPVPKLVSKRRVPAKSLDRAAQAFKNFSATRFANGSTPVNYVPADQAKVPSAVRKAQRETIGQQLTTAAASPPTNPGLTVALPSALLKSLLPSLEGTKVDLTELLTVLRQRLPGTELYAAGEPTITRVVREAQQLAQVQAFIKAIKSGEM